MPHAAKYIINLHRTDASVLPVTYQINRKTAQKIIDLLKKDVDKVPFLKHSKWVETVYPPSMLNDFMD